MGVLILGICILVFLLIYNRNRVPNDKVNVLSSDVLVRHDEFLLSDTISNALHNRAEISALDIAESVLIV